MRSAGKSALAWCVLATCVPLIWTQEEAPGSEPSFDEDIESEARAAEFRELKDAAERTLSIGFGPGSAVRIPIRVPANGTVFPDILVSMSVFLRSSNADIYCTPGTHTQSQLGQINRLSNYEWKSSASHISERVRRSVVLDHSQGRDYVFISRYHPAYKSFVSESQEGIQLAHFVCAMVDAAWTGAHAVLQIDLTYESRNLVQPEQSALEAIFAQYALIRRSDCMAERCRCCKDEGRCDKWKEHMQRSNANEADFCHFEGNVCSENGHLIRLNLNKMNMSCPFPGEDLAKLTFLEKLQMQGNPLTGPVSEIFEEMLKFKNVHQLEISDALFTGPLADDVTDPEEPVCQLARGGVIDHLDLENCGITGTLPACLFDEKSGLAELDLKRNLLSGELPKMPLKESGLLTLSLNGNQLTGAIPVQWTKFKNLLSLDLSDNQFTNEVPVGFGSMRYLQFVNLANNELTGSFPTDFLAAISLLGVNISHNQFSGELPKDLVYGRRLVSLSCNNNNFTGLFPLSLTRATGLQILDLAHNELSGTLPDELGNLRRLESLSLNDNAFTGPLPTSLSKMIFLLLLDLQSNAFNGTIPTEWNLLIRIVKLNLANNQLEGTIPGWMHQFDVFEVSPLHVDLTANRLTGFDNSWYSNVTQPDRLAEFHAAQNQIQGEFPKALTRQQRLKSLNLAQNAMNGLLPSQKSIFSSVVNLNLSSNSFNGSIPTSWANSSLFRSDQATVMDLSHNELSGKIPSFLFNAQNSDMDRQVFLQGNDFDLECPLPSALEYIADLSCDETKAASHQEAATEQQPETDDRSVRGLGEKEVPMNQYIPETSSTESASSSSILVPVMAAVAAGCFAIVVVLLVLLIKMYRASQAKHQSEISMTHYGAASPETTDDKARMFSRVESSSQV